MNSATLTVPLLETAGLSPRQSELLARGRKAAQGMLPNMYRAMAYSPALLATYLYGYEALRKEAGFTPAELEVIFLVISDENACDYCVAAHSLVADTLSRVPRTVTDAIRSGQDIPDSKLSVLAEVTRRVLLSRGRPEPASVQALLDAGYDEKHLLGIVLAIGIKTLSNYTNHLFDTPLDSVFKVREFKAFKAGQRIVEFFSPRRE
jgi:AhpD family alkylhydroperoxidase